MITGIGSPTIQSKSPLPIATSSRTLGCPGLGATFRPGAISCTDRRGTKKTAHPYQAAVVSNVPSRGRAPTRALSNLVGRRRGCSKFKHRRNINPCNRLISWRQNPREERDSHRSGSGRRNARLDLINLPSIVETTMRRRQSTGARNKLDLNDRVQVRIVRKRLKVSNEQLASLVRTAGNSITAVRKEAGAKRLLSLP